MATVVSASFLVGLGVLAPPAPATEPVAETADSALPRLPATPTVLYSVSPNVAVSPLPCKLASVLLGPGRPPALGWCLHSYTDLLYNTSNLYVIVISCGMHLRYMSIVLL